MFNSCQSFLKCTVFALLALAPLHANALTLAQEPLFLQGA